MQEQVDGGPDDDRARRAVEQERDERAGRRVFLQVAGGMAIVRHDDPDLGHAAGLYIVDFKLDQTVLQCPLLGRSLLGAEVETAHAD